MGRLTQATVATAAVLALIAGGAPAASASSHAATTDLTQTTETTTPEAAPGSLFHAVEHAPTQAEKIRLLEAAGFTQTADVLDGLTYEQSEGGLTVGYVVTEPVVVGDSKQASTQARLGWDGSGPYMNRPRFGAAAV
jgi:hypothetical protein